MRPVQLSLLILLCLAPGKFISAQSYYFKNYQVNNGLSSNTITCITQNKDGFMWFGTRNGLNRFDGNSFRNFQHNIDDSLSLGSNSIFSLFEDNHRKLWIGTSKGIYLFNPEDETFTPFSRLSTGEVRSLKGDLHENIWIVATRTLYRYNQSARTLKSYSFGNDQTTAVSVSPNGTVWATTDMGILKKYNAATDQFTDYNVANLLNLHNQNEIQEVYPESDSLLLVGTMTRLYLYNPQTGKVKDLLTRVQNSKDVQIHQILQQSKNIFWAGTETGLYIIDLNTGKVSIVRKTSDNPYSITDNVIYSLYKDAEGNTWIGTFFGGVNYYSKEYNQFKKYFPHSDSESLSGNLVHEICTDNYGHLWVGTEDAGLNKINLSTGSTTHYMPGSGPGSIAYNNIHGLLASGNEMWIGTYEHGLDRMNIQTGKVIRHYDKGNGPNALKSNFIVTLYKTRNGDILVGTWNGMFRYNPQRDDFSPIQALPFQIQCIREDDDGTLWVASYGKGIYRYNPATQQKDSLKYEATNKNSLINDYVNSLFKDSRENWWFCTEGGLCEYNPKSKIISRYTVAEGLPDNQTFRALEDNEGQIWISTSKGLAAFNPANKKFTTYTTSNGLLTNQFNYNSGYKSPDGTLYFGSVKGMISFNPRQFSRTHFIPPVYITGLQINNSEAEINKPLYPLHKSITYVSKITLPYDSSTISLDVAALSYSMPELNEYEYKMDGLDKEWTVLKTNRKIYYTKLAPGEYTFRLKGAARGGIWNNQERTLAIRITPPLWATNAAYLLYFLIASGIITTILRYYYLAIKEKNKRKIELLEIEKEREIYNAKIEFFTNVAHEIRTPLTLIKMPLDKLLRNKQENDEITESLEMMKKNTNRLINLTNQLLDFRKAEANKINLTFTHNDINLLLSEIFQNFRPAAEQKKINYQIELPRIALHAYVDSEAFKKIISNLLNNAIKYADKFVALKLLPFSSEDSTFTIEVRNDGHTIPYDLKEKVFEPFYRMKETEKLPGTGIGLPLSRSLAELHRGLLELKQPENKLNTFVLTLPIHQETEINLTQPSVEEKVIDAPLEEEEPSDGGKTNLLVVEDNREIQDFLYKELKSEYHILRAANGSEALQVLLKENVGLIISDIMMPIMDGIELCKRVKSDLQHSHIPIILLTAKNTLHSKIEGLEVGADAYIEKPFAFEHLQAQITNLLANRNKLKEYFAHSPLTHIKGIAISKADSNFLEALNNIISENITDMDLDVDKLAKLLNMSRPTLYRKIKGLSDLTPNELINVTRLKMAANLLAEGKYKINEVAGLVGYSLATNFSRDFHKQFGFSPSQYLQQLKKEIT